MKLNISLLEEMLEKGYVRKQQHPEAPLWIYNYTVEAQYERVWNDITLQCRGLILGHDYAVVARPFGKFFNLGEQENQHIPNEPFEVYEKWMGRWAFYTGITMLRSLPAGALLPASNR